MDKKLSFHGAIIISKVFQVKGSLYQLSFVPWKRISRVENYVLHLFVKCVEQLHSEASIFILSLAT